MNLDRLKQINEQKANDAVSQKRHNELLLENTRTQEVFIKTIQQLVRFMDNKTTKTEVINQLRSIGTPDVEKVVGAVKDLHTTIKTHENTDLSEVTAVLRQLLSEAKQIPKSHNKIDIPEPKDYSRRFDELANTVKAVEAAVKAQQIKVDAPIVNVPETQVTVEAVDLKPIETSIDKGSKDVVKAVKGLKLPELNTDPLEKLLKKTNKLLSELPELMPSGGGGGGLSWVTTDTNGIPVPIQLTAENKVPVEGTISLSPTGLMPFEFDDIQFTDADANGNYQTATVQLNGVTQTVLTFSFDDSSKLTGVSRS